MNTLSFTSRLTLALDTTRQFAAAQLDGRFEECLLVGLCEVRGVAASVLDRLGLSSKKLAKALRRELVTPVTKAAPLLAVDTPVEKFLSAILAGGEIEAENIHCNYLGTEHALLALLHSSAADRIERRLSGFTYTDALRETKKILPS